jgi:hypothetical protein
LGLRAPLWATNRLDYAIAYVLAKHDHRWHLENKDSKEPSWLAVHGFSVPRGEHVRIPGLFIVELFPPSESHLLQAAIERHHWSDPLGLARADQDLLADARSGTGYDWWKLGGFANLKAWAKRSRRTADQTPRTVPGNRASSRTDRRKHHGSGGDLLRH